jgi:hypothetical protein
MLINIATGKQVILQPNKEYSDHFLRQHREVKAPLSHKGHAFFQFPERAIVKNLTT